MGGGGSSDDDDERTARYNNKPAIKRNDDSNLAVFKVNRVHFVRHGADEKC